MTRESTRLPIVLPVLIVLAIAGYFGWRHYQSLQPVEAPVPIEAPVATPEPPASAPAAEPAIQHPIEPPSAEASTPPAPLPALADSDAQVIEQLNGVLGQRNVASFLHLDGIVRRVVATVDNLGRAQAPVLVWPVKPTPGRFSTLKADGQPETIAADNGQRYTPFVAMAEAVNSAQAVALYRRLYPLFQQAYEELGFPGRYFNDRLVQVLDQLIATPVQTAPLAVTLVEVKGPVSPTRPWVRYEYADPALESLSAGQKILLRTGPENHRRLQAKLKEIRQQVARR